MVLKRNSADFLATARNGIVTSPHPLASRTGLNIIKKGGNAIDAAIATAFALTVVDPCMSGIAGRGEINLFLAEEGMTHNVEFVAVCGEKAQEDMFEILPRSPGRWWTVKDDANNIGYRSICVPTALAGLCATQERFGTMELEEVIEPSIKLATEGFEVDANFESMIDRSFEKISRFPAAAQIFCPGGRPLMRGQILRMKDYASTLNRISEDGPDVFYKGDIAKIIVKNIEENSGLITVKDMASYEPNMFEPLSSRYRDYEIVSGSPDCSGGRFVLESLNILENFDLKVFGATSFEYFHILSETFKQVWSDRLQYEADPCFTEIPAKGLLSKNYAKELKQRIFMDKASRFTAGNPWKYEGKTNRQLRKLGIPFSNQGTAHLCVADRAGNMVTLTETLCGNFGSGVVIPGTGILTNNGMNWFNPIPGSTNSIQPGKRHIANMAATLILDDGEAMLVTGAGGGRRILTTVTELVTYALDFKEGVTSLFCPRFHIEDEEPLQLEQLFYNEIPLAYSLARALSSKGHRIQVLPKICIGCMIMRNPETGLLYGAAESREHRVGSIAAY